MTTPTWQYLARPHGVAAHRQLLAAGMTKSAIRHAVRSGRLHVVYRGVYAVGDLMRQGRWAAAVLSCGEGARLSWVPAGLHWGILERGNEVPHVSVPGNRTGPPGVQVHRAQGLKTVTWRGIAVTPLNQTIIDLAGVLEPRALRAAIRRAVSERSLDLRALGDEASLPLGDWRKARVRTQLELWLPNEELTQSALEARFYELMAAERLPLPELQRPFGPYRSDFVWREAKLVVETDGRLHLSMPARQADAERDRAFQRDGLSVMRYVWADVVNRPRTVRREVRQALTDDGPAAAGPS